VDFFALPTVDITGKHNIRSQGSERFDDRIFGLLLFECPSLLVAKSFLNKVRSLSLCEHQVFVSKAEHRPAGVVDMVQHPMKEPI